MTSKKHLTAAERVKAGMPANGVRLDDCDTADWREVAERRLTRLTEVEHDLSEIRDRLARLQLSYRLLLQQSDERLLCIRALKRELEELHAAHGQLQAADRKWLPALRRRIKKSLLILIDLALRVPLVRPVARGLLRISPRLGGKLRARFRASRQPL
jgi:hypothetical protein